MTDETYREGLENGRKLGYARGYREGSADVGRCYDDGYREGSADGVRAAAAALRAGAALPGTGPFTRLQLHEMAALLDDMAADIAAGRRTVNPSGEQEPASTVRPAYPPETLERNRK